VISEHHSPRTTRNRGTEYIKSPEMLLVANADQKTRASYDRRKLVGASAKSDVWSVGCLLYELLTGEYLFEDDDWIRFFIRITGEDQQLLTPEMMAPLADYPALRELLESTLMRDPIKRPSMTDLRARFESVRVQLTAPGAEENAAAATEAATEAAAEWRPEDVPWPVHRVTENDDKFYSHNATQVLDYLYLGARREFEVASTSAGRVVHYGFTHVIDCQSRGVGTAPLDTSLECLDLFASTEAAHTTPEDLAGDVVALQSRMAAVTDFVRACVVHNGRCVVVDELGDNAAAMVVIGYLMEAMHVSYTSAALLVRGKRLVASPSRALADGICRWHTWLEEQQTKEHGLPRFTCLCGSCHVTLHKPFDSTLDRNPRPCNCRPEEPGDCPSNVCSCFLDHMRHKYDYTVEAVTWGYTDESNIVNGLDKHVAEHDPISLVPAILRPRVQKRKLWRL